jgi:hypothetical protein
MSIPQPTWGGYLATRPRSREERTPQYRHQAVDHDYDKLQRDSSIARVWRRAGRRSQSSTSRRVAGQAYRADRAGGDLDAVTLVLEREGVQSFCDSYDQLLDCIEGKLGAFASAGSGQPT